MSTNISILSTITEFEDTNYGSIIDNQGVSNISKEESNAEKHFNQFFEGYCTQMKWHFVPLRLLWYNGTTNGVINTCKANLFWANVIEAFFTYLYRDAHKYRNPSKPKISYETATGYASSVKMYLQKKFRHVGGNYRFFRTPTGDNFAISYSLNSRNGTPSQVLRCLMVTRLLMITIAMPWPLVVIGMPL